MVLYFDEDAYKKELTPQDIKKQKSSYVCEECGLPMKPSKTTRHSVGDGTNRWYTKRYRICPLCGRRDVTFQQPGFEEKLLYVARKNKKQDKKQQLKLKLNF